MEENIDFKFNEIAAKTIKKYREQKDLSLEDVVRKMKSPISRQSLFKYENNLARMKNNTFNDICNAIGIDSGEIFEEINSILVNEHSKLSKELNEPVETPLINKSDGSVAYGFAFANEKMMNEYMSSKDNDNSPTTRTEILFNKTKDILNDDERAMIEATMERAIKKYEEEKNKNGGN